MGNNKQALQLIIQEENDVEKVSLEKWNEPQLPKLNFQHVTTKSVHRDDWQISDIMLVVWQAIEFAKEQDDEELWDDLINYSLDKPGI